MQADARRHAGRRFAPAGPATDTAINPETNMKSLSMKSLSGKTLSGKTAGPALAALAVATLLAVTSTSSSRFHPAEEPT
jgi:hypothetical protein